MKISIAKILKQIHQTFLLVVALCLLPSYRFDDSCLLYKQAFAFIENDAQSKRFLYIKEKTSTNNIIIGKETIAFDLNSLEENVISRDYIKGYSFFSKKKLSYSQQQIEKYVIDSLSMQTTLINSKLKGADGTCPIDSNQSAVNLHGIVFFSKLYNNEIYAELMQLSSSDVASGGLHYSQLDMGETLTFLFAFRDGKLVKEYRGKLYKN